MSDVKNEIEKPVELNDEELDEVSGGAFDAYLHIDGVKGESTNSEHKG